MLTGLFRAVRPAAIAAPITEFTVDTVAGPAQVRLVPHPRATRLRLAMRRDGGGFRLTTPPGYAGARAIRWAHEQEGWMAARLASACARIAADDGAVIPVKGVNRRIIWSASAARTPLLDMAVLHVGGPQAMVARRIGRFLKAEALALLDAETRTCANLAGVAVNTVSVADPKSRWGSCAARGAIRYSWRLILMPDAVRQSIVAHEVAHLVHMNHGRAFHELADRLFVQLSCGGSPVAARRWLKAHGTALHRFDFAQ